MSNALVRKKKRMQPLGYSKSELIGIQKYAKAQNNADYLITESYYNVRMMAYQALHDMFGFGQKRIIRVEQTIETYLGDSEKDGMSAEELGYFMKTKFGIDVREETNKIPYRESFYLVERKIAPNCMIQANKFYWHRYLIILLCWVSALKHSLNFREIRSDRFMRESDI